MRFLCNASCTILLYITNIIIFFFHRFFKLGIVMYFAVSVKQSEMTCCPFFPVEAKDKPTDSFYETTKIIIDTTHDIK